MLLGSFSCGEPAIGRQEFVSALRDGTHGARMTIAHASAVSILNVDIYGGDFTGGGAKKRAPRPRGARGKSRGADYFFFFAAGRAAGFGAAFTRSRLKVQG